MAAESPRTTLGVLALVVGLLAGFALLPRVFHHDRDAEAVRLGQAPDFALAVVANGTSLPGDKNVVRMSELRGHVVLLDFWATWCGPCQAEAPIVDRLSRRWRDQGVVVVGVNEDTPDQGDPRAYALHEGLTYPIVRDLAGDESGATLRRYNADSLPTLIVVSGAGTVIGVRTGPTSDAELERLIRLALKS